MGSDVAPPLAGTGVAVGVSVGVAVNVLVAVAVGVGVGVDVAVGNGVSLAGGTAVSVGGISRGGSVGVGSPPRQPTPNRRNSTRVKISFRLIRHLKIATDVSDQRSDRPIPAEWAYLTVFPYGFVIFMV